MSSSMNVNFNTFFSVYASVDSEWQKIISRLRSKYGVSSTGSKAGDTALLHRLELQEAQETGGTSTASFLEVTKDELEKIKNKKREKNAKNNPQNYPDTMQGAKISGEQIYLVIKMKQEE